MKIALVFLGLAALTAASVMPTVQKKVADKVFLQRQKAVLELLWRVNHPVYYPEILEIAQNYRIEENLDKYTNVEAVKNFVFNYKYGMLPQGEVFSILNEKHKEEVISLFDVFYYAKDFDTFYNTAAWARVHVNAGQFVYALSVAVIHREDTRGLVLPPPYEIYPQLFVDTEVIQKAYESRMYKTVLDTNEEVIIPVNKTFLYPYFYYYNDKDVKEYKYKVEDYKYQYNYDYNLNVHPENRLAYFTEDVALNAYNNYFHLDNPFWMNMTYDHHTERRGELFYYYHQQILARYLLERLSNDLADIDAFRFGDKIEYGYNPSLRYPNGKDFPVRPDNLETYELNSYEVRLVKDFERRIVDAIDLGYVYTEKGEKVSIYDVKGIDILGHMIQSTVETVNYKYYGKLYTLTIQLLGHIVDHYHGHNVAPGVLENYETVLRDPLYYRILASITQIFLRYKSNLPYYQREELVFPGVKVDSLDVDKLVTYFDKFDIDISSAVGVSKVEEDIVIKARQYRLNHKPFTYRVNVVSDKNADVMVRVFLGPKYDNEGRVLDINDKRKLMVEIDRFPYQVTVGQNTIQRNSREILSTVEDYTTVRDMYKNVMDALKGKTQYYYEDVDRHCAYPSRLLLPKGKKGGMPFTFFVAVTPITDKNTEVKYEKTFGCGYGLGLMYQDKYAMGYPFDRVIDETQFYVPNFYEKDVVIFHKRAEDINNLSI